MIYATFFVASPPIPLSSVKVIGPVIVWSKPSILEEDILSYDVRVASEVGSTILIEKNATDFCHLLSRDDTPADLGGSVFVVVQVKYIIILLK